MEKNTTQFSLDTVAAPDKTYLETLNLEVPPPSPYSPEIGPSDYHLLHAMPYGLFEQQFKSYEDTNNWVDSWIPSKYEAFFRGDMTSER